MDELNCLLRAETIFCPNPISRQFCWPVYPPCCAGRNGKRMQPLHWKNLKLDLASGTISLPEGKSHPAELSRNELKILYYLMKHAGKIVSREELVDYLWDEEIFIDDNALSVNMTRLRSKLNPSAHRTLSGQDGDWGIKYESAGLYKR